jgi:threonine dehydrogenase-like Zn-dependent dehydrogenase
MCWDMKRRVKSSRSGWRTGLTFRMPQTPVQHYLPKLLERSVNGDIDPSFVITHTGPLERGHELYKTFRNKQDNCIKVIMKP